MIPESLIDRATLYAASALSPAEREQFEILLEFHTELQALVTSLLEASTATILATQRVEHRPSAALKERILAAIPLSRSHHSRDQGFVVTDPDGLVEWVNPAFSAMCGYSLAELRGKKLGPILQGPATDPATVERVRQAVHARRQSSEALVNYHKNGTPYWVSVNITPFCDDSGNPLWLVAREVELPERAVAV